MVHIIVYDLPHYNAYCHAHYNAQCTLQGGPVLLSLPWYHRKPFEKRGGEENGADWSVRGEKGCA